jgi:hypothetical protein
MLQARKHMLLLLVNLQQQMRRQGGPTPSCGCSKTCACTTIRR